MLQSKRVYNETPLIELQTPTILFNAAMRKLRLILTLQISVKLKVAAFMQTTTNFPLESVEWNLVSNRVIIGLKSTLNIVSARLECRDKNQRLILAIGRSLKILIIRMMVLTIQTIIY